MIPQFSDSLLRKPLPPPIQPGDRALSFYACGITPYAPAHIGHGRSFVVFDLMARVLRNAGYTVDMVRNITDIDDKIIGAANAEGVDWHQLAHRYADQNRAMMAQMGVNDYEEPLASKHIVDIVELAQTLVEKGIAYQNPSNDDLLFEVERFNGSDLARHQLKDLVDFGAHRVTHDGKRSPADFVLWKQAKPGEPAWDSPWGRGRPGWHVECSAMIAKRFGGSVDYHGGGIDLRFPHHQAEIAQSEAAFERPLAQRWVHHGSVRDGEGRKMSKSLGNTVGLEDTLARAETLRPGSGGDVVRLALLSALWTRPLDWHDGVLEQAANHIKRWVLAAGNQKSNISAAREIKEALADNLNTPLAITRLHLLSSKALDGDLNAAAGVRAGLDQLGLTGEPILSNDLDMDHIRLLLNQREQLRKNKQWAQADEMREKIETLGFTVRDK